MNCLIGVKKTLNSFNKYERGSILRRISGGVNCYIFNCDLQSLDYHDADVIDKFLAIVGTERFCKDLVDIWRVTEEEKAQLFGLAVIYPSGQNTLTHTIEFSIPKNSLLNWSLENRSQELQEEFLAIAGHQLDLWLSAELDMGSGNIEGQFQYNVG